MLDRNDEPPYPIEAISLLKTDHRKVKISLPDMRAPGIFALSICLRSRSLPSWSCTRNWKRTSSIRRMKQ
jgi:hypothetical protein